MAHKPLVLYQCLLDDLSPYLPKEALYLEDYTPIQTWPDITPKQFASVSLLNSVLKKLRDSVSVDADQAALKKFLAVNQQCKDWVYEVDSTWEEELIGTVKRHLDNFFYTSYLSPILPNLSDMFCVGRNGPGSSLGSVGQDDYTKLYSSDLTSTSESLYRAYRASIVGFPILLDAELKRLEGYDRLKLVEGNRLSFVPKQRSISRVTCTEPILNMYAQLGAGSKIEARLRSYFNIDIAVQPECNKELACIGSVDGSYSTIDLASASDSMSLTMMKKILPVEVYDLLVCLRSPVSELPDGSSVELAMLSTMGNGYTFPLQTALFASVVSAVYDMLGVKRQGVRSQGPKNWGVFGDDIIVEARCFDLTVRALEILGFKINADKSFDKGSFRESCGGDFFRGHHVRGVYAKTFLTSQSRAVLLNRLHEWSAVTGIPIVRATKYLYSLIPKRFVPPWESYDAGIQVPFSLVEGMRRSRDMQSILYSAWIPRRRTLDFEVEAILTRNRRKYNPDGLLLSFLRGHIRRGKISLRQRETLYTTKTKVAPGWDRPRKLHVTDTCWRRWNTAVWLTVS